jgi:hypothetical protein
MSNSYQSDLSYKEMLTLCQTNKDLAIKWLTHLFKLHMPNLGKLDIERPLISTMNFTPLPYYFQTSYLSENDKIERDNRIYYFKGQPGDRIMYANRRVPSLENDAIPFTFPVKKKNTTKLYQSNIFYFEIELLKNNHRESWDKECISIGYGTSSTSYKNQVGWTHTSWGFHSDDGCFLHSMNSNSYTSPWEKGDVIGVGLKYYGNNRYSTFLTKNGVLAGLEKKFITDEKLYPMIGLDVSFPIKVNFGDEEFIFDIECYIDSNEILNNKNTFLHNKMDINSYTFIPQTIQNSPKKINILKNIIDVPKDCKFKHMSDYISNDNKFINLMNILPYSFSDDAKIDLSNSSYVDISHNLNKINNNYINNNVVGLNNIFHQPLNNMYHPNYFQSNLNIPFIYHPFNYLKVTSFGNQGYAFTPLINDSVQDISGTQYNQSYIQDISGTQYNLNNILDISGTQYNQNYIQDISGLNITQTYVQELSIQQIIQSLISEINTDEKMEESDITEETDKDDSNDLDDLDMS